MGKQQRTIPHGRYRLLDVKRPSKPDKLCTIYIEYSWNSAAIRLTTGYRFKVSDWNQKGNSGRGEFRSSYGSEFKRINNVMKAQLDKMDNDMAEYSQNHFGQMSTEIIKGILDGKPLTRKDEGRDFIEFTNALAETGYKRNVIGISRKKNFLGLLVGK